MNGVNKKCVCGIARTPTAASVKNIDACFTATTKLCLFLKSGYALVAVSIVL